jgi:uncharacterized protein (DUF433 family)
MSLLSGGIYSIPQAARLLNVSPERLRFWVCGRRTMQAAPIIKSELEPIEHQIALSFINLIEVKFINAFSKYGVNVRSIRYMVEEARRVLAHPHPFATSLIFRTDGRKIFIETAEKMNDKKLYDLKGKNWGIYDVLMDGLKRDVIYGPSGLAEAWYPRKEIAPDVFVHPKVAFGQPALEESGVPTEALYDAYRAEDEDFDSVARWFSVPAKQVKEAVNFQVKLQTLH